MKTEPEKLKEKLKEEFTVMKTDQATTSGWFKRVLIVLLKVELIGKRCLSEGIITTQSKKL